jgi:hypothetical protein
MHSMSSQSMEREMQWAKEAEANCLQPEGGSTKHMSVVLRAAFLGLECFDTRYLETPKVNLHGLLQQVETIAAALDQNPTDREITMAVRLIRTMERMRRRWQEITREGWKAGAQPLFSTPVLTPPTQKATTMPAPQEELIPHSPPSPVRLNGSFQPRIPVEVNGQ